MAEETSKAGTQWMILIAGCAVSFVFAVGLDHWKSSESATSSIAVDAAEIANLATSVTNLRDEMAKRDELERQVIDAKIQTIADQMRRQEEHLEADDRRIDQVEGRK